MRICVECGAWLDYGDIGGYLGTQLVCVTCCGYFDNGCDDDCNYCEEEETNGV